jgi:hypothetical protein
MHVTNGRIRPTAISPESWHVLMHLHSSDFAWELRRANRVTNVQKDLICPAVILPGSGNVLMHPPSSNFAWEQTRANACDNLTNVPLTNDCTFGPFDK